MPIRVIMEVKYDAEWIHDIVYIYIYILRKYNGDVRYSW